MHDVYVALDLLIRRGFARRYSQMKGILVQRVEAGRNDLPQVGRLELQEGISASSNCPPVDPSFAYLISLGKSCHGGLQEIALGGS